MNDSSTGMNFCPLASLVDGAAHSDCDAIVIVPARNEERGLWATLDGLAAQVDITGCPLPKVSFEVLLLLNNCTDTSMEVAKAWKAAHPHVPLHIIERTLSSEDAHVGMARRLLMDTAWRRLTQTGSSDGHARTTRAILSTDADSVVAPDWIARNLRALEEGADAVGGEIRLTYSDLQRLPLGARRAYLRDRQYQRLVAELEDLLDPQAGDPWPRHLEHFGASLACRAETYARVGGMPPVAQLEDVAFVDLLRRMDARLRHDTQVVVHTSSRLDGRVGAGLSKQLCLWQQMSEHGRQHKVLSADWLTHRFRMLRRLRNLCRCPGALRGASELGEFPAAWRSRLIRAHAGRTTVGLFLGAIGCDRLIEETFQGMREEFIDRVNGTLVKTILDIQERQRAAAAALDFASSQTAQSGSYPSRVVTEIDVNATLTTLEKAAV
ncbi:MAG: hypothetical protein NVSMB62_23940 [Acidobacteriaceae bacterium]